MISDRDEMCRNSLNFGDSTVINRTLHPSKRPSLSSLLCPSFADFAVSFQSWSQVINVAETVIHNKAHFHMLFMESMLSWKFVTC